MLTDDKAVTILDACLNGRRALACRYKSRPSYPSTELPDSTPDAPYSQKATWRTVETKRYTPLGHLQLHVPVYSLLQSLVQTFASSRHCFWYFLTTSLTQGRLLADFMPAFIHLAPSAARRLRAAQILDQSCWLKIFALGITQFSLEADTWRMTDWCHGLYLSQLVKRYQVLQKAGGQSRRRGYSLLVWSSWHYKASQVMDISSSCSDNKQQISEREWAKVRYIYDFYVLQESSLSEEAQPS